MQLHCISLRLSLHIGLAVTLVLDALGVNERQEQWR